MHTDIVAWRSFDAILFPWRSARCVIVEDVRRSEVREHESDNDGVSS
jgi:hypothetical protein